MYFRFANERDSSIILKGLIEIELHGRKSSSFFSIKEETEHHKRIHDAITNNSIMVVEDILYSGSSSSSGSGSECESDSSVSTDSSIDTQFTRQVVGFIWFTMTKKCFVGIDNYDFNNSYVYISYVWVNRLVRGRGIAKELYTKVVDYCKQHNIKKVWLDITLSNQDSMDFHEKIGFEPQVMLYSKTIT